MDVTRQAGGWLAACGECGQTQPVLDVADGWQWLLGHDCAGISDTTSAPAPAAPELTAD